MSHPLCVKEGYERVWLGRGLDQRGLQRPRLIFLFVLLGFKEFPRTCCSGHVCYESLELENDFWTDIPQPEVVTRKHSLIMNGVF